MIDLELSTLADFCGEAFNQLRLEFHDTAAASADEVSMRILGIAQREAHRLGLGIEHVNQPGLVQCFDSPVDCCQVEARQALHRALVDLLGRQMSAHVRNRLENDRALGSDPVSACTHLFR